MLGKLFKPHWQHPKAEVRLKAVALLDLADATQQDILAQLAKGDCDSRVRCGAIARLSDLSLLQTLSRRDADASIQEAATLRQLALLSGAASDAPSLENRLRAIRLLNDKPLLTRLLDLTSDSACLLAALDTLDDQALFARFAIQGADISLREKTAQRVTEPALLRQLARDGRDKKVVQLARDTLKQQQHQQQQQEAQQQQLADLLQQLQQHAGRSLDPLYEARLTHLQEQWQTLAPLASPAQAQAANQHLAAASRKLADQQAHLHQQQAEAHARTARQQCLDRFADFLASLDEAQWQIGINALSTAVASLDSAWQDAIADFPASAEEHARQQQFSATWQSVKRLYLELDQLRQAPGADTSALAALLADWPTEVTPPAFIAELQPPAAVASTEKQKPAHARARHGGLLHQLRQSLKARHLKDANRAWHRLEQAQAKYPDATSEQQAQPLKAQLDELRDWHAFAADPKKDTLCQRMETLVTTPLSHPEEQANAIQALHDEWHALMSANQEADQSLWDRFKQASDSAYDHCRDYFRELDAKRAENLGKRQAIVQQLHDFLEQQDWDKADGNALWQIRCQAPKDWQAASPVRFTDAREVGQQFHQLLKQFDASLDTLSLRHQPQLEKLLAEFDTLAQQADAAQAARQARQLQRAWREAGWVHPQQFRKLDKRKRQLCDSIFGKQQDELKQEQQKQQQLAHDLKQELDLLKEMLDAPSQNPEQLDAAMAQLRQQPEPANDRALTQQKQALLKRATSTRSQQLRQQQWQGWQQLLQQAPAAATSADLRQLCVAMEVSAGCPSPTSARDERLAWQVENLAHAMKSERLAPAQACAKLLEEQRELIASGLDDDSRQRLTQVIAILIAS